MDAMESIQSTLALPEIRRKETRQALQAVFKVYRNYKEILRMGFEPLIQADGALPGYEDAAEPSTIRAQYKYTDGIMLGYDPWNATERRMQDFIDKIDRKVNGLHPVKAEIIRRRYLCDDDPLPTDDEVVMSMCNDGFYISDREYDRKKGYALQSLACALGLERIEITIEATTNR